MYKLKIVAGPNRGASFDLQEGETSIGRNPDNTIILPSNRVTKKHCSITILNDEVTVQDHGSSNGTFVNGALTKFKRIKSGDRISLGEFILEFHDSQQRRRSQSSQGVQGLTNIIQFPGAPGTGGAITTASSNEPPKDYQEKAKWYVEKGVLPFFYGLLLKHEWKVIGLAVFVILTVFNLLVSIQPLIESNHESMVRESAKRAAGFARQLVDKNSFAIASQAETKTEVGAIEREEGVETAVLIDMKARILSPPEKMNQYLTTGSAAVIAISAIKAYDKGSKESGFVKRTSNSVVAIEPIKVFDPALSKNTIRAVAVVSIDITQASLEMGEIGVLYSEALVITGTVGLLLFFVLYRITMKPLEVLNEDLDKVLRGEMSQVTHEFKWEELNSLWSVINSTVQRIPRSQSSEMGGVGMSGGGSGSSEAFIQQMKQLGSMGSMGSVGVAVCDDKYKIIYTNTLFEDVTGIRFDASAGKTLPELARDQAFTGVATDLLSKAAMSSNASDEMDFSGMPYRIMVSAQGSGSSQAFAMILAKKEAA